MNSLLGKRTVPTLVDDKRIEFHEILKHGRDTRPEQVWVHVAEYYIKQLDYDVTVRDFFGIFMAHELGWPEPSLFQNNDDVMEVYVKAWVKRELGVLPEPFSKKYSERRNDVIRLLTVGELTYMSAGFERFCASIKRMKWAINYE